MSALLDLAARVEALSGPDREVDAEIAIAAKAVPYDFEPSYWTAQWREMYGDRYWSAPGYTASLDAAITLLPDGMGLRTERYWTASHEGAVWSAEISTGGLPDNPLRVFECFDAATPALALTAAALRAKAGQP